MGGSCIGKIPHRQHGKTSIVNTPRQHTHQPPYIQLEVSKDGEDNYPQYQIDKLWNGKNLYMEPIWNVHQIVHEIGLKYKLTLDSLMCTRLYTYQHQPIRKFLGQNDNPFHSLAQPLEPLGEFKAYQVWRVQTDMLHPISLYTSPNNIVLINMDTSLIITPASLPPTTESSHSHSYHLCYLHLNAHNRVTNTKMEGTAVKPLVSSLKQQHPELLESHICQNVYLNGIVYETPDPTAITNQIFEMMLRVIGYKRKFEKSRAYVLLYENWTLPNPAQQHQVVPQTYLELKSYLEMYPQKVFNLSWMEKIPHFYSVYLMLLATKLLPADQDRLAYIKGILHVGSTSLEVNEIFAFVRCGWMVYNDQVNDIETKLEELCVNVFRNMDVLIDGLLVEFGIEVDEKVCPIRNDCLWVVKTGQFSYMQRKMLLVDNRIVVELATIRGEVQSLALSTQTLTLADIQSWKQKTLRFLSTIPHLPAINPHLPTYTLSLLKQHVPYKNPNIQIIIEYCLSIQILELFIHLMLIPKTNKKAELDWDLIYKLWHEIIQTVTLLEQCSGELMMTIYTIEGILRSFDVDSMDGEELYYLKVLEIWTRIRKDPRVENQNHSNYWLLLVLQNLVNSLKSSVTKDNRRVVEDVSFLENLMEVIQVDAEMGRTRTCPVKNLPSMVEVATLNGEDMMKWILLNIPTRGITSIFYHKAEMGVQEERCSTWMKTGGSSVFETGQSNNRLEMLSNRSYESDLQSNNSMSRTRTRKGKTKKIHQLINSFEWGKKVQGGNVLVWGKGISTIPMMNPYTKGLLVFKIACGNYHVVMATSEGIMGWGENSSGQLGKETEHNTYRQSHHKQYKKVRTIWKHPFQMNSDIKMSCGNEHTGVLFEGKLYMWGQEEGGILGGNGWEFDDICCGGLHTLAIKDGDVYSWGRGEGGQLGHKLEHLDKKVKDQSTDFFLNTPKRIPSLSEVKKCVCGDAHSVVLTESGSVYVFGFSYQGQLGLGLTGESQIFQIFEPVKLCLPQRKPQTKIVDIFAGSTFTFVKTSKGEIYSFGMNDCMQLGIERVMKVFEKKKKYLNRSNSKYRDIRMGELEFSKPCKLEQFHNSLTNVLEIHCGDNHCIANVEYMNNKNMMMGWGLNRNFQISCEYLPEGLTPRTIDNLFGMELKDIGCGGTFTVALVKREKASLMDGFKDFEERVKVLVSEQIIQF